MVDAHASRVLAVGADDTRASVVRTLRAAGFTVVEATTGRRALDLASDNLDVIVLEGPLRGQSAFDLISGLRSSLQTAAIPILYLSASFAREDGRLFDADTGADAYLTEPSEPAALVATVRALARMRRLEAAQQSAAAEWQATFDAIGDVVCVIDSSGVITRANRAALGAFAQRSEDVIGQPWGVVMTRAFPGVDDKMLMGTVARGIPIVRELRTGDRWLCLALDPLPDNSSLEGAMVAVVSDVSIRMRAEAERSTALAAAEAARAAAERANNAKGEFLATMSHEIRTPINAILGYTQLLDMGIVGAISDKQREQLDRLRRSAAHLLRLVNEVFDLASDVDTMRIDRELAPSDEVLEDALAIGRPLALGRAITIASDGDAERLLYVGDVGRVRQVLVNLLSNAVKFSPPGGRIDVSTELTQPPSLESLEADGGRFVAIRIRDSGVGIPSDQLKHIFDPFMQAETGRTRSFSGSGLGLTISRRLARLMGGDITVESEPGHGSLFTLWLPAAADQIDITTVERRGPHRAEASFDPMMFAELGRILTSEALSIGQAMSVRLRTTEGFPPLGALSDSQLVDHIPAYVADLGVALVIVSEVGAEASTLLHDGNGIRNEIAERHGAQRCRIGWSVADIRREYDLLLEEIKRAITMRSTVSEAQLHGALELLARLVAQSAAASVRGYREAQ
jgi:PAS domain S-box-containing protein